MTSFTLSKVTNLWQNAGFQRYFQNTGWLFTSRIITLGLSFVTTIFIARNLGPTNFGQLSYAVSFISIFSFIATLGIDTILYRNLLKAPEQEKELLGTGLFIKISAGFIAACITIGVSSFFVKDVSTILIIILSGTFICNAFQLVNYGFQARSLSKYPALITLGVTIILNIFKVLAIYFGLGVIYLALILLLESALYAVLYIYFLNKKLGIHFLHLTFNPTTAKELLYDSWPLIFSSAFALIYARIDQIFIKHMIDAQAVGIYDAAVKVAEVWYFIPGIIVTSLFPALINAKKTSELLYISRLKKLSLFLVTTASIIAFVVTIFAQEIMNLIYGKDYSLGVPVLQIYAWSGVGMFLVTLFVNYLITENFKRVLFIISFVPMLINIVLNILWIPVYGIVGAAYATLISYSLAPLILFFFKDVRVSIFNKKHEPYV